MLPTARSSRRTIALVAAMVLLLCQAALAARACANYTVSPSAASVPCHQGSGEADPLAPPEHTMSACEAPALYAESANPSIAAVTALPALLLAPFVPVTSNTRERDTPAGHAPGRPPPLTILHCRFLN
jgi:hypothetical protein